MASWGMLGAGLSAMGDTLGKYAMQRISSDEALAREKSLADYKIEMQEKMDARAAEAYAKKVGAARTAAQGSLQGRIDDETRLPGLLSTRARTEAAWNDRQPAGAPVIRPEDQTTEETALRDLSAQDRDVLRQNIAENIAYAKSLRPSGAQVDMETFRQLRQSEPSVAEKFGKELKTEADIAALSAKDSGKTLDLQIKFLQLQDALRKADPNSAEARKIRGEMTAIENKNAFFEKHGYYPETGPTKGDKAGKPSADERKTEGAVARLDRIRVRDTSKQERRMTQQEFAALSSWANISEQPGRDVLAKAPPWVRDTINGLGGIASTRELLKEAGPRTLAFHNPDTGKGSSATVANTPATASLLQQYNEAVARAGQIADPGQRAKALREIDTFARAQGLLKN